jgi:hypothetical protein
MPLALAFGKSHFYHTTLIGCEINAAQSDIGAPSLKQGRHRGA